MTRSVARNRRPCSPDEHLARLPRPRPVPRRSTAMAGLDAASRRPGNLSECSRPERARRNPAGSSPASCGAFDTNSATCSPDDSNGQVGRPQPPPKLTRRVFGQVAETQAPFRCDRRQAGPAEPALSRDRRQGGSGRAKHQPRSADRLRAPPGWSRARRRRGRERAHSQVRKRAPAGDNAARSSAT